MSEHQHAKTLKTTDNAAKPKNHINQPVSQHTHPAAIIQQALAVPGSLSAAHVLQLQRTIGNRAVAQLMSEIGGRTSAQSIPIQLQGPEEEELQKKVDHAVIQRQEPEEEELFQGKFVSGLEDTLQTKPEASQNNTGMPDHLKSGLENLSTMNLSSVRVHHNSSKPAQLNALAYTQGQAIHVAPGQEKHLPHEGWHAVQQMQGRVKPTMRGNGVLINDDEELEREADAMGQRAAQGLGGQGSSARRLAIQAFSQTGVGQRSVHDNTSENGAISIGSPSRSIAGAGATLQQELGSGVSSNVIQMLPESFYGEFKTTKYDTVPPSGVDEIGVDIELEFHPDKSKVDAKKIGLTQNVHSYMGGTSTAIHPTQHDRMVPFPMMHGVGSRIDRIANSENPLYGSNNPPAGTGLAGTPPLAGARQLGWHYFDVMGAEHTQKAVLTDRPVLPGRDKNAGQEFETTALAVEGAQEGSYMGSVSWGWTTDDTGAFTKKPLTLVSADVPSEGFMTAAEQWNQATTLGTIKTTASPTNVYDSTYSVAFTVARDSEVSVTSMGGYVHNDEIYNPSKILSAGKHHHKTGRIKVNDLADQGDGAATIDLPVQWVGTITVQPHLGTLGTLREGRGTGTNVLADLPVGTRVKVMDDSNAWLRVEVDSAQAGVILNSRSRAQRDRAGMLRGYVSQELVQR